jgi:hypothetical protein
MRSRLAKALAFLACFLLVTPASAGHEPAAEDAVASFARAQLSNDSVLALLLLLVAGEQARVHAQLQALYEASYVSTAPSGSDQAGRLLGGAIAARYRSRVADEIFGALIELQRLWIAEMREDRDPQPARLRAGILRAGSKLGSGQASEFAQQAGDWFSYLQRALHGLGAAELEMLQIEKPISARQKAISLTTSMIAALNATAKQIGANTRRGSGQSSAPAGSVIEQSGDGAEPAGGAGGGCSIDSDSCP